MRELVESLVAEIPNLARVGLVAEKASQEVGLTNLELWDHFRKIVHAMAKATHYIEEARKLVFGPYAPTTSGGPKKSRPSNKR